MSKKDEREAVVNAQAPEEKPVEEPAADENQEALTEPAAEEAPEETEAESADKTEETDAAADEEASEAVSDAADEADAEPASEADSDTAQEAAENTEPASAEEPADESAPAAESKKKPFPIQIPVLISLGIVVLALIGYFVYTSFFLHLPEGIIWVTEDDGITYYYEFGEDNVFMSTVGSVEQTLEYEKITVDGEDVLRLYDPNGIVDIHYSITGSRIRKDQVMTITYGDETDEVVFYQVTEKTDPLELPTDFTPDQELLGEWLFTYDGTDYQLFVNDDGSITYQLVAKTYDQNSRIHYYSKAFKGTYTITDGVMNWTIALPIYDDDTGLYEIKPDVSLEEYELDGDSLVFLRMPFLRVLPATPDEA